MKKTITQESGGERLVSEYNNDMKTVAQFENVSRILYWLVENQSEQPTLTQLSRRFGTSEFHLQRTFQEFAGVSPKQFLKYLSKKEAIARLRGGQTVLETALDIGMSGPGRLHDLLVTTEAVTPGQIRGSGQGINMHFGVGETPFGNALVAWTDRGVSFLGFCHKHGRAQTLESLKGQWPSVCLNEEPINAQKLLNSIFENPKASPIKVWLRGSPFQLKVWEALLKIPPAAHCSYGQIAQHIGKPNASRAIGTAIGRNPVSWLIPCHRVITSMGTMGGYRWGVETKQAMIGVESARCAEVNEPRVAI
jgi:AraC family transcriptional regulator of adaptative response/methylated-DNA-[protein]-cysteine methyltransferase